MKEKRYETKRAHRVLKLLRDYNKNGSLKCNGFVSAQWNTLTNLTNAALQTAYVTAVGENAQFKKDQYIAWIKSMVNVTFTDKSIQRQIKLLSNLDTYSLDDDSLNQLTNILLRMVGIYNSAKVCPFENQSCDLAKQGLPLDPSECKSIYAFDIDFFLCEPVDVI